MIHCGKFRTLGLVGFGLLSAGAVGLTNLSSCGDLEAPEAGVTVDKGEPPPDDVQDLRLLARVDKEQGGQVSFYEPVPGQILLHETSVDGKSLLPRTRGLTAVQLFQKIAPGKIIPEPLLDAQKRADSRAAPPDLERPGGEDAEGKISPAAQGARAAAPIRPDDLDLGHFVESGCSIATMQEWCDYPTTWVHCAYYQTSNAWIQRVDTDYAYDAVCVPSNYWVQRRIEGRTWWEWRTYATFTVFSGTTDYTQLYDYGYVSYDFDYRSTVFNVYPDTYHWVANGWR